MPDDLSGCVALVSGASRGVGRAYALALAAAGARVLATARSGEGDPAVPGTLAELEATARAGGLVVAGHACDVADDAAIAAAIAAAVARFGGLDILVNNAVWPIRTFPALAVPDAEWDGALRINLRAPYAFIRAAVPHMRARGGGSIVNVTSGAAGPTRPGTGAHGFPAYAVSKAALERLTTYCAAEFVDDRIAVNAVSPGKVGYFTRHGAEPEVGYWGPPIVHLAARRPPGGLSGRILHTYGYGTAWGPRGTMPPPSDAVRDMLRVAGVADGMAPPG